LRLRLKYRVPELIGKATLSQTIHLKFVYISLGVLGVHLAGLGWLQVSQPEAQPPMVLAPVQTRQILAQPDLAPLPAIPSQEPPQRRERLHPREIPLLAAPSAVANPKTLDTTVAATPTAEDSAPATGSEKPPAPSTALGETASSVQGASSKSVTLPSSMADYLSNPPPTYPPMSLRLNEQGKVVVRVLIGRNGRALDGRIAQSSGFDRLDQAALRAVMSWRYVPGTVDGQAQDMWFDVPVNFKPPN